MMDQLHEHATSDLKLSGKRPQSAEVRQGLKTENSVKALKQLFGDDLSTLQPCTNKFSLTLCQDVHGTVTAFNDACEVSEGALRRAGSAGCNTCNKLTRLAELCNYCNNRITSRDSLTEDAKFRQAAYFLRRFLEIRPYSNGNGRTARMLTSALLMQLGAATCALRFDLPDSGGGARSFAAALGPFESSSTHACDSNSEDLMPLAEYLREAHELTKDLLRARRQIGD